MRHVYHDSDGYHVSESDPIGAIRAILLTALIGGGLWALFFYALYKLFEGVTL